MLVLFGSISMCLARASAPDPAVTKRHLEDRVDAGARRSGTARAARLLRGSDIAMHQGAARCAGEPLRNRLHVAIAAPGSGALRDGQALNWRACNAGPASDATPTLYGFTFYSDEGLHSAHVVGGLRALYVVRVKR